ncbi:thylakoid lumenal 17.4 kDa protein, chloroplastic [Lactuca sativa]|uniref:thylakoid lumenal 17.4 kDa protein, chloroplastic n=1 Tax=Lactuca sativa TaxID=4236 RepID=UPI000CAADEED|nr:thylakoid lumenal 17.4 kDa protein, chloroplastic [Lactuca sativa]
MASMALSIASLPIASSSSLSFSRSCSPTDIPLSLPSSSISLTSSIQPLIYCGRGDKNTAKRKRFNHSFGNARPQNNTKGRGPPMVPVPPAPPRKDRFDDGEVSDNPNDSISKSKENSSHFKELRNIACGVLAVLALTTTSPVIAANQRLPPLSTDPERCERAFVGNTIGQANGVYDKAIDLRFCDYTNDKTNLKGKSLAAALMSDAKFDGADMTEVIMSKAYAVGASFKGTDFTNAVLDRVNFGKANLQGASFKNTVLSGSTFEGAQLQDVVFEDTIIGYIDLQKLCVNKTINEDSRLELGCRN